MKTAGLCDVVFSSTYRFNASPSGGKFKYGVFISSISKSELKVSLGIKLFKYLNI